MFDKSDFQISSEKQNYVTDIDESPGKLFWENTNS